MVINGEILIDCGVPMKTLRESGYIKSLKLVLLTHIHGDHFNRATVRALHKERPALRFGCCEWMVRPLLEAGVGKYGIDVYEQNKHFLYPDFAGIEAVPLAHDVQNCGYKIETKKYGAEIGPLPDLLFYATDCSALDGIDAKGYDLYLIEGNHQRSEIEARIAEKQARGEFAYEVRAARNHLSQEQALDWLARNAGPNSKYVFLHQHKEDNNEAY